MSSKSVLAALAGALTLFLLGYVLYGLLLMDFYTANTGAATGVMKDPPDWLWLLLGQLAGGALLVLVLGWAGSTSLASGLKAGALFGLLMALFIDFTMYGTTHINNLTVTILDPIVAAIHMGVAGAVVGAMLGRGQSAT